MSQTEIYEIAMRNGKILKYGDVVWFKNSWLGLAKDALHYWNSTNNTKFLFEALEANTKLLYLANYCDKYNLSHFLIEDL